MDFGAHDLWTRAQLLGSGLTDDEIRRELGRSTLESVRPGVYTAPADGLSAELRHVRSVRAAALSSHDVVSHQSAALMHGLRMWNPDLRLVHMTVNRASSGRRTTRRHLHASPLRPEDVVDVDGLRVTSAARTIADLARTLPFEAAVCLGDSALRSSSVTRDEVIAVLEFLPRRRRNAALAALEFLSVGSESVGESRSRVFLRAFGFPEPELQVELTDEVGRFIARVDLLFDEQGVVAEFDGYVKYTSFVPAGSTPGAVAFAEKRREDDLRSHGWVVVRWVWADLAEPHALAARIRRAFAIAESMPRPRTGRRRPRTSVRVAHPRSGVRDPNRGA